MVGDDDGDLGVVGLVHTNIATSDPLVRQVCHGRAACHCTRPGVAQLRHSQPDAAAAAGRIWLPGSPVGHVGRDKDCGWRATGGINQFRMFIRDRDDGKRS